jgi:hypothetical protein
MSSSDGENDKNTCLTETPITFKINNVYTWKLDHFHFRIRAAWCCNFYLEVQIFFVIAPGHNDYLFDILLSTQKCRIYAWIAFKLKYAGIVIHVFKFLYDAKDREGINMIVKTVSQPSKPLKFSNTVNNIHIQPWRRFFDTL